MKLIAWLSLFISVNALAINCPTLWSQGFPDPGRQRTPFNCTEFSSGSGYQLYYSDNLNLSSINHLLVSAQEALERSIRYYSTLGAMPPVKAVVYHRDSFRNTATQTTYAEAFINWHQNSETCPVIIYPAALTFSQDYFKQMFAHEMFHCFQWQNARQQAKMAGRSGIGAWWVEGTAQYFSNVVYPSVDLEYSPMFAAYQHLQNFFSQDYANVHLFQSWGNNRSNASIVNFMSTMPTGATPSQESAFTSVANIENILHDFVEEMISSRLQDSSGRRAPLPAIPPQAVLEVPAGSETWTRDFVFMGYTVNYLQIRLPAKSKITIKIENADGAKVSIKKRTEENWSELPQLLETTCDEAELFDLAVSKATSDAGFQTVQIVVDQEENEECPCQVSSPPRDACLYGTWDVDISTVRAFYERMMAGAGDSVQVTDFSGAMTVTFNRNGTGTMTNSDLRVVIKMQNPRSEPTIITNEIWGTTTWNYTTHGRGNICSEDVSNNLQGRSTVEMGGMSRTIPLDRRMLAGASLGTRFTYECSRNNLLYKTAIGVGPGGTDLDFNYSFRKR